MTEQATTVSVKILDKDYQVSCPPDEVDALKKSAEYLDKQMQEIRDKASVFGLDRIAVMAALNITNDLLKHGKLIRKRRTNEESQLGDLSAKLDQALSRFNVSS